MKKICLFGDFDPAYGRNRVVAQGFAEAGAEIFICRTEKKGLARFRDLYHHYRMLPSHDVVFVAYSDSRTMVPFARLISSVPIVWDAFYSLYDTRVTDRSLVSALNPKGWAYWFADVISAHLATRVMLDTRAHAEYFTKTFFLPERSVGYAFVGTDERVFYPRPEVERDPAVVTVGFYGKYIPLQGVEVIVRAAHLLRAHKHIHFVLLGSGQTYRKTRALAEALETANISFQEKISYEALPALLASFDVALGIFGTSGKASRVIPNKVFEAMAMGKPIITADTSAARELLSHTKNAFLVPPGDARRLAEAIELLAGNGALRRKLGAGARETFLAHAQTRSVGEKILSEIAQSVIRRYSQGDSRPV